MNNGVVRDKDNNFSRHQTFKDGVTIEGGLTVDITGLTATTGSIGTLDVSTSQIGTLSLTNALTVSNGGTGLSTLAAGLIPYGAGTSALASNANLNYDAANSRLNTPVLRASTGVLFGNDIAAANTLDDYEEGTWPVTVTPGDSGSITLSSSAQTGHYTKIGDRYFFGGRIIVDSVSSPLGHARVSLPATVVNNATKGRAAVTVWGSGLDATAKTALQGITIENVAWFSVSRFEAGADINMSALWKAGTTIYFSGSFVAA